MTGREFRILREIRERLEQRPDLAEQAADLEEHGERRPVLIPLRRRLGPWAEADPSDVS